MRRFEAAAAWTLSLVATVGVSHAQIPANRSVAFTATEGLLVDPYGAGVVGSFPMPHSTWNSLLDPVTGDVFSIPDLVFDTGNLFRTTFDGLVPTTEQIAVLQESHPGLLFDGNGNVLVTGAPLRRWNRSTGLMETVPVPSLGGHVAVDRHRNELWSMTLFGDQGVFSARRLDLNHPEAGFGPPLPFEVTGFTMAVTRAIAHDGRLFAGAIDFSFGLGTLMLEIDTTTGDSTIGPSFPVGGGQPIYDPGSDLFHYAPNPYQVGDLATGSVTQLTSLGAGSKSLVVSNFTDTLQVFPRFPEANQSFLLEATMHGEPGDQAVIVWMGAGPAVIVAEGTCDAGGGFRWSDTTPANSLGEGEDWSLIGARLASDGFWRVTAPVVVTGQ